MSAHMAIEENGGKADRIAAKVVAEFERNPEAWGDGSEEQIRKLIEDWRKLGSIIVRPGHMALSDAAERGDNVEGRV